MKSRIFFLYGCGDNRLGNKSLDEVLGGNVLTINCLQSMCPFWVALELNDNHSAYN